jgi:hypothetical protein
MRINQISAAVILLVLLVASVSLGAIYGGVNLISDPTGGSINFPKELLENSIFSSYLIPGLILFLFLGVFPLMLIFPLLFKPRWRFFDRLNIYLNHHWAWTLTLYTSIMLIIWIDVQIMIIGYRSLLQGIFGLVGVAMLILTLLPSVKKYYVVRNHGRD